MSNEEQNIPEQGEEDLSLTQIDCENENHIKSITV